MSGGTERYLLFQPEQKLYHCGMFLDPEVSRAYLFHSLPFARQGLMKSMVDVGEKSQWRILRAMVDWDEFGDLVKVEVQEEIQP